MEAFIDNRKDRVAAFILSLLVFSLLMLFFVFFLFKTPIPPYPPSVVQIVDIDFAGGGGEDGKEGNGSPVLTSSAVQAKTNPSQGSEDVFTSQVEDPNITAVKETRKKDKKKDKKVEQKIQTPETPQASEELVALIANVKDKLKKSSGNSENSEGTGKSDNGTGIGKGNSVGSGDGPHTGPGSGNGYSLRGRKLLARPQLLDNSQEEGIVVVEIIVNAIGKVIDAIPGQRGSTTASAYLYTLARQAAKTAKFSASTDGAQEQKGTYTFVFKLD